MPHFNGPDYQFSLDFFRLTRQHDRIKEFMRDGEWRTLKEIEAATGYPSASISAQLRHLRKKRFGSWLVDKRRRGIESYGVFEYRISPGEEENE